MLMLKCPKSTMTSIMGRYCGLIPVSLDLDEARTVCGSIPERLAWMRCLNYYRVAGG